jgi:hypothetical protein
MSTQSFKFTGKVKWCRPDQTNEWGKFSTRFYPDNKSLEEMKKLAIKNTWSTDEDGEFTNVSCPKEKDYRGRKIINKIVVIGPDGNDHYSDVHGFVGDGSDVELWIDYYDHPIAGSMRRGHAIKWTGMKIINLAPPYTKEQEVKPMPEWGEQAVMVP